MRLLHRATNSVASKETPAALRYESAQEAFYQLTTARALEALLDCREYGTVTPSYYWELGGARCILWAVTPCRLHTARYYPEEWAQLVAAADAAGIDLRDAAQWQRLTRCGGH